MKDMDMAKYDKLNDKELDEALEILDELERWSKQRGGKENLYFIDMHIELKKTSGRDIYGGSIIKALRSRLAVKDVEIEELKNKLVLASVALEKANNPSHKTHSFTDKKEASNEL
jgi:hypothetical protein